MSDCRGYLGVYELEALAIDWRPAYRCHRLCHRHGEVQRILTMTTIIVLDTDKDDTLINELKNIISIGKAYALECKVVLIEEYSADADKINMEALENIFIGEYARCGEYRPAKERVFDLLSNLSCGFDDFGLSWEQCKSISIYSEY